MRKPKIENFNHKIVETIENDEASKCLELKCEILSEEKPKVTWIWNRSLIDERDGVYRIFIDNDEEDSKKWKVMLKDPRTKNGHSGVYEIVAENEAGISALRVDVTLNGFNPPDVEGKPFLRPYNDVYCIGLKYKNSLTPEFSTTWFRNGKLIDINEKLFSEIQKLPGETGFNSILIIHNPEKYLNGIYKVIVENSSGKLICVFDLNKFRKAPQLAEKVRISAEYSYDNPDEGRRETAWVRIHVPFISWGRKRVIRWSVNQAYTASDRKFADYKECIENVSWNSFRVILKFRIKSDSLTEETLKYRCEIFDEGGKLEAFAIIRKKGVDENLFGNNPIKQSKNEKNMKTMEDDRFFEILDIGKFY